jgi:hypothetical protein
VSRCLEPALCVKDQAHPHSSGQVPRRFSAVQSTLPCAEDRTFSVSAQIKNGVPQLAKLDEHGELQIHCSIYFWNSSGVMLQELQMRCFT